MDWADPIIIGAAAYFILATGLAIAFPFVLAGWSRERRRFAGVIDAEIEADRIKSNAKAEVDSLKRAAIAKVTELVETAKARRSEVTNLKQEIQTLTARRTELERAIIPLDQAFDDISNGFTLPQFELQDHAAYVVAIKTLREQQKQMARDKLAVVCPLEWHVGGSRAEGKRMTDRTIKLTLRAFNGECDVILSKVSWSNIGQAKKRINQARDVLNKLNESHQISITDAYLALKLREANLINEEQIKREEEKERLRAIRELEREEAKAQCEILAEMKRQEARERERTAALAAARIRLSTASPEHRAALEREVEQIEAQLGEAAIARGRLTAMAEHTRIGHVYIISNRGAFGEAMVKIGMTRRLDPLDRVRELGDASVPFPFDLHAMIFSNDAPSLERDLHAAFEGRRVNRMNLRKEFFAVHPNDVATVLAERLPGTPFRPFGESIEFEASRQQL